MGVSSVETRGRPVPRAWRARSDARWAVDAFAVASAVAAMTLGVGCSGRMELEGASTAEVASALVASGRVPGLSFAVLEAGEFAGSDALGAADLETGERVRRDTLFEGASLTKPVVAAIAMRLFDAGVFVLDEPIAPVVEAPRVRDREAWSRVTARQLLSHTSGLPNWSGDPQDLDRVDTLEFDFPPGEGFSYSGEGYGLLQEFLERESGRPLAELSRELFEELGMSDSTLVGSESAARGHWGRSPSRPARRTDRPVAASSLLTHADDYVRFLRYEARGASVSPRTLAEFRELHATIERVETPGGAITIGWSLGWGVLERPDETIYFQWGDNGPFRALAAFGARTHDGVVFLANGSDALLHADALARPTLGDVSVAAEWFNRPGLEWLRKIVRY